MKRASGPEGDIYWDEEVLSILKRFGIRVIDVNHAILFSNSKTLLKSIKQSILGGMKHHNDVSAYAPF